MSGLSPSRMALAACAYDRLPATPAVRGPAMIELQICRCRFVVAASRGLYSPTVLEGKGRTGRVVNEEAIHDAWYDESRIEMAVPILLFGSQALVVLFGITSIQLTKIAFQHFEASSKYRILPLYRRYVAIGKYGCPCMVRAVIPRVADFALSIEAVD